MSIESLRTKCMEVGRRSLPHLRAITELTHFFCFWFSPPMVSQWFAASEELDAELSVKFKETLEKADKGLYDGNLPSDLILAKIILFDQLPRNIYRGTARSFSYDSRALRLAADQLENMHVPSITSVHRLLFLLLPFMHSEDLADQQRGIEFLLEFERSYNAANLNKEDRKFLANMKHHALGHLRTIQRFSRFPKRNGALGRETTKEEKKYIKKTRNLPY